MKKRNLQSALRSSLQKESVDFEAKCRKADSIFTTLEKDKPNAPEEKKDAPSKKTETIVRCSVSMTEQDYESISHTRKRCFAMDVEVSRSEVLRLGIQLLLNTSDSQLKKALSQLHRLKSTTN
ncbi:MAG: hypothetical protein AAF320_02045 [Myxococcota bacterium]